jgi:hypothetical protein
VFDLYGPSTPKRYKTFLATWRPAGGVIRLVLVDEPTGPVAFFRTDPAASGAEILGLVADRFALETAFRDCEEVGGAGQRGGVPRPPVDVDDDRRLGLGPLGGGTGGPIGLALE